MEKFKFNKNYGSNINNSVNVKCIDIKWIDFKQFIREDNLYNLQRYKIPKKLLVGIFGNTDDNYLLSKNMKSSLIMYGSPKAIKMCWLLFIPGPNLIYLLSVLLSAPIRAIRFRNIAKCVYDIESNRKVFKLIRDNQGRMGVIRWNHCGDCKLILKPHYETIRYINDTNVVTQKKGLFGLYNLQSRNWTLPCIYDSIISDTPNIIIATNKNSTIKVNIFGERVM